jgi:putative ABC transport system substrate-binding protein
MIGSGLVASLKRPGGNVTGVTLLLPEMNAKRLELLKEVSPQSIHVAVLVDPNNLSSLRALGSIELAAPPLNLQVQRFDVSRVEELMTAFSAMRSQSIDSIVIIDDANVEDNWSLVSDVAAAQHLASIGPLTLTKLGTLIGYGPDLVAASRRMATFVHKIINGAKPDQLPVEQAAKIKLVINLKTAKKLGIKIPFSLLTLADELIE